MQRALPKNVSQNVVNGVFFPLCLKRPMCLKHSKYCIETMFLAWPRATQIFTKNSQNHTQNRPKILPKSGTNQQKSILKVPKRGQMEPMGREWEPKGPEWSQMDQMGRARGTRKSRKIRKSQKNANAKSGNEKKLLFSIAGRFSLKSGGLNGSTFTEVL